ncbi:MAG: hypothetical protein JWM86_1600 [Thermoleophilia bacterium]|nr:hypothetical protein [Thermoleophilia bacterium]
MADTTVIFDGGCAYCRRQARRIEQLDWLGRFTCVPYDDAVQVWPDVSRELLGDGLRVRFDGGSVPVGIDAVRSIALRMPLTAIPALLLWVPGIHALGAWAYGIVARRRQRDRVDGQPGCAI